MSTNAACIRATRARRALIQVAYETAAAGPLDIDLLQHTVLDDRGARFARRHVDEDLDAQERSLSALAPFQYWMPAACKSSPVSNNGNPITAE